MQVAVDRGLRICVNGSQREWVEERMRMKARLAGVVWGFVAALAGTGRAVAQHQTFHIDPRASLVEFLFDGSTPHVEGTFRVEKSDLEFDRDGPKMGGSVTVKAGSERSGVRERDLAMRAQVLQAQDFGDIVFEPRSFTGSVDGPDGRSLIQVKGTITLLGVKHEVTVPVDIATYGHKATVRAHFVVPYVAWGLKDLTGLSIQAGPEVVIDVMLLGSVTTEE